jgi:hypothetical protein
MRAAVPTMSFNLDWVPEQKSLFQKLVLEIPSRELRQFVRVELTRRRGVLFNSKFIEPKFGLENPTNTVECPTLANLQGVILDLFTEPPEKLFSGELALLAAGIGEAESAGRSLRLVRHALQLAALFHSYLKLVCHPQTAPRDNVNRNWQLQLWEIVIPLAQKRAKAHAEHANAPQLENHDTLRAVCPAAEGNLPSALDVSWTTSASTRQELRNVASAIATKIRNREITDLSRVAVVLPPRQTQEYAVQLSGIFAEEFNIPFVLHEPLNNAGSALAPAFLQTLRVLAAGSRKAEILALLLHDAFAIVRDAAEEQLLRKWTDTLGVVHGINADDLSETFVPEKDRHKSYHWLQAIDRLAVMALSAPDTSDATGVPRQMLGLVQRVTNFVSTLSDFRRSDFYQLKSLNDWSKTTKKLARKLFSEKIAEADADAQSEFHDLLRALDDVSIEGSTSAQFDFVMINELLRRPLSRPRRQGRGMHRHGVPVFSLKKGALRIPFEHVFLLGAEDGQMPRVSRISGMHLFPKIALEQPDTVTACDTEALRELLLMPNRKIFISHIEKNISNGEKKRPSHTLLSLIPTLSAKDIKPAPVVRPQPAVFFGLPVWVESNELRASTPEEPTSESQSESFGSKKISVSVLADYMSCPVVATAKHKLRIAENPLPREEARFPDAELSFIGKVSIAEEIFQRWLSDPEMSDHSCEELLRESLRTHAAQRVVPASNREEIEFKPLQDLLSKWRECSAQYRPSHLFSLGRTVHSNGALILPEIDLGANSKLCGKLHALVHLDERTRTATATVLTNSSLKKTKIKTKPISVIPPEPSSKAMLTLCALSLIPEQNTPASARDIFKKFRDAQNWRLHILTNQFERGFENYEKTFAAWSAKDARDWLGVWSDLLNSDSLPKLLPLKRIYEELIKKGRNETQLPTEYKLRDDFFRNDIDSRPYSSRYLLGDAIMNQEFEVEPLEVLRQRYPWIFYPRQGNEHG